MVDNFKKEKGKKYRCKKRSDVEVNKTVSKCTGGWEEHVKGKRKLSAYNKYVRAKMPLIKEELEAPERLRAIGRLWRSLTKEEQDSYK